MLGSLIGQGLFFATSAYFLHSNPTLIGDVSTGYGSAILLSMIVDWGGATTQRQFSNHDLNTDLLWRYFKTRSPIAMIAAVGTFTLYAQGVPNPQVASFLIGATPGILSYAMNLSGALDVLDRNANHAYLQALPTTLLSAYLLISDGPTALMAGLYYSSGCAFQAIGQMLLTSTHLSQRSSHQRSDSGPTDVKKILTEGIYVLSTNLPGQLISRLVPITLTATDHSSAAATYNFLKQSQGLINQIVTLARRAEYNLALSKIKSKATIIGLIGAQKYSIFLGLTTGTIGYILLICLSSKLQLEQSTLQLSLLQSLVWVAISSHFFHLQLQGNNLHHATYSLFLLASFAIAFSWVQPTLVAEIISLELASSIVSFMLLKYLTRKNANK